MYVCMCINVSMYVLCMCVLWVVVQDPLIKEIQLGTDCEFQPHCQSLPDISIMYKVAVRDCLLICDDWMKFNLIMSEYLYLICFVFIDKVFNKNSTNFPHPLFFTFSREKKVLIMSLYFYSILEFVAR